MKPHQPNSLWRPQGKPRKTPQTPSTNQVKRRAQPMNSQRRRSEALTAVSWDWRVVFVVT